MGSQRPCLDLCDGEVWDDEDCLSRFGVKVRGRRGVRDLICNAGISSR